MMRLVKYLEIGRLKANWYTARITNINPSEEKTVTKFSQKSIERKLLD